MIRPLCSTGRTFRDLSILFFNLAIRTSLINWVIGELVQKFIMLYPMDINTCDQFTPLLMCFLFGTMPVSKMTFDWNIPNAADRSNAKEMHRRLILAPCPSGIFITVKINWKENITSPSFGGTHTTPTLVGHERFWAIVPTRIETNGNQTTKIHRSSGKQTARCWTPPVLPIINENQQDTLV